MPTYLKSRLHRSSPSRYFERRVSLLSFLFLCTISLGLLAEAAQKKGAAGSLFVQDKGKFNILLDGNSVGHEEFEINPSGAGWVAKGNSTITVPGAPPSNVSGTLTMQPDGAPISYDWTAKTDKTNGANVVFANGIAKMTLQMQGAHPFEQDLTFSSPFIVVLDNNLYYQYAVLARVYDWARRGTQNFSVLIPQELIPGTITVDSAGNLPIAGKNYEALKVVTSDLEVVLYLDSSHRLMRIEVPSAKVSVVRE
jgi:hypothetical protein